MKIKQFSFCENPNTAILRLTRNFGLKKENEPPNKKLTAKEKAKRKHASLVYEEMSNLMEKMKEQGIKVITVGEDKYIKNEVTYLYPDQVFLTDTGHYFVDESKLHFVPAFFKYKSRRGEEETPTKLAAALGATIWPLQQFDEKKIIFEGGDFIQAPNRSLFFLGYGQRTEKRAIDAMRQIIKKTVIPIKLLRKEFFHLDCCVLPLPNDALVLYEGEYIKDANGHFILDKRGLPLLKPGSQTMTEASRCLLREIYDVEKIILLSTAEALAFGANAVILKSDTDNRYKLFVNGDSKGREIEESIALQNHLISYFSHTKTKILEVTENMMDIFEVPYKSLHYSYGSVHCTVEETFLPQINASVIT
ncbi:Amidinotransferase [Legionella beliardensis]|uniref:arginine deiminase n=1 Tax=Legionella beliardensis TaxID=91822 RepID=A0A378I1D2_9GAMM|nr:arginine deiminase-related protein [Legionella beliardensis]STX28485.1 Amidinotransferase [Legionella beliardensis]